MLAPEATDEWAWILAVAVCAALFSGFGIGANDAANSFTTTQGAGTLSLRKCLLAAAFFEFLGAFFLGARVTETIRKSIVDVSTPHIHHLSSQHFARGFF